MKVTDNSKKNILVSAIKTYLHISKAIDTFESFGLLVEPDEFTDTKPNNVANRLYESLSEAAHIIYILTGIKTDEQQEKITNILLDVSRKYAVTDDSIDYTISELKKINYQEEK